jgi:hypothetical protein
MRTELTCETNTPCQRFQLGKHLLYGNSPFSPELEKHAYHLKNAIGHHLCFSMRTGLAYERITPHLTSFSCGTNIPFLHNSSILLNWGDTCISWNNTMCAISRIVLHIVFLWEFRWFVKGLHSICQHFQVGETFTLCKTALFSWIEQTHVSLGTIPSVLEAAGFAHYIIMRIELACEKTTPYW